MNPNTKQITGVVRIILVSITSYLAGKGILSATWADAIIGIGTAFVLALWSYYENSITKLIDAVAESNHVEQVITTPSLAISTSSPKVVPITGKDPT